MTFDDLKAYCLALPEAEETYPFGPSTLVIKVCGKMFALLSPAEPPDISLKCDPDLATVLRQEHAAVQPGYHLNKRLWNTVACDGSLPDDQVYAMIDHSYEQVVQGLRKADRERLQKSGPHS